MTSRERNVVIDNLGTRLANIAMVAACDYIKAHGLRASVDIDALVAILKADACAALGSALDDAKAAYEAGMGHVAEATMVASFRLVGINAAKKAVR